MTMELKRYASAHGARGLLLIVTALLALVPASELVIQIIQRVISASVPSIGINLVRSRNGDEFQTRTSRAQ